MARSSKVKAAVSPEAASKAFEERRWREYVRLSCVEIASARGVSAQAAMSADQVIDVAKALANFVHQDG